MSDHVYLIVAVSGTFAAALLGGYTVVASRSKRRTRVLQTQLMTAGLDIRTIRREAAGERIVGPFVASCSRIMARLTPVGVRDKLAHKLVLAGSPNRWTAERVLALKWIGALFGAFLGYLIGAQGGGRVLGAFWIPIVAAIGLLLPGVVLGRAVTARQERIRRILPDAIDLLTISVEAGLAFDAALLHVRRSMKGPLSEEIGRMLHEINLGVGRSDAFRHLSERTEVQELKGFILALVQADIFGVSIGSVLRAQSHEMRVKRRQRAEERSMKVGVKLLFPMIFCILPALLIVVAGPGVVRIVTSLLGPRGLLSGP